MATPKSTYEQRIAAQSAVLITFLECANPTLSESGAKAICASLDLNENSDFKAKAKILREELARHGIHLKQTNALEALARMAGFTSYMRAKEALARQTGEFSREGFLLRLQITGEHPQQFRPYASLPEAANVVVEEIAAHLTIPREPVFCELRRTPQAITIEISRAVGPWLLVELLPYSHVAGKLEVAEFDAESQKVFLERVLRLLERGRPGTLALYGVIPQTRAPWNYAGFTVKFAESGVEKFLPNERELFLLLDSLNTEQSELINGEVHFTGSAGPATLRLAWSRFDEEAPNPAEFSPAGHQTLVERFRQWRRSLGMPVREAVVQVLTGSPDATATQPLNAYLVSGTREKKGMSRKDLAVRAGLTEQDVQRIEKFGFASEQSILSLANALELDPNALVNKPNGQVGLKITEAQHLLNALKNAQHIAAHYPEELEGAAVSFIKATAVELQELGDLLAIGTSEFYAEDSKEPFSEEPLLEHAQYLLDSIHDKGLQLIASRGLTFTKGVGQAASAGGVPLQSVAFQFLPVA